MSKKSNDSVTDFGGACERKSELLDYLYDEATPAARQSFERHLDDCASCEDELRAFGRVRNEMSAWQVGFAPRTEVVLPRSKVEVLRELFGLFPVWARGLALTGAAAALVLFAFTARAALRQQPSSMPSSTVASVTTGQVEQMVQEAVAQERKQLAEQFAVQLTAAKQQLAAEHEAQLQAANAAHAARIQAVQAGLRSAMKRSNAQLASVRGFFEASEYQDPWSSGR